MAAAAIDKKAAALAKKKKNGISGPAGRAWATRSPPTLGEIDAGLF
jgi:hypothetical protein